MALLSLHYSDFFKENLLDEKISGTVITGEWTIPAGENLLVFVSKGNVEESVQSEKIGSAKIIDCFSLKVSDLTDKEAKICGYEESGELKEAIKHWHKCDESAVITFVEFEFNKQHQLK